MVTSTFVPSSLLRSSSDGPDSREGYYQKGQRKGGSCHNAETVRQLFANVAQCRPNVLRMQPYKAGTNIGAAAGKLSPLGLGADIWPMQPIHWIQVDHEDQDQYWRFSD